MAYLREELSLYMWIFIILLTPFMAGAAWEPWGMWSGGLGGHIYIQFEAVPSTDLILSADIIGFTGEAHPRQDINILANGSPVGRWVFAYGEPERERKLLIPMKIF